MADRRTQGGEKVSVAEHKTQRRSVAGERARARRSLSRRWRLGGQQRRRAATARTPRDYRRAAAESPRQCRSRSIDKMAALVRHGSILQCLRGSLFSPNVVSTFVAIADQPRNRPLSSHYIITATDSRALDSKPARCSPPSRA